MRAIAIALLSVGCTGSALGPESAELEGSERMQIYALHPYPHDDEGKPHASSDDFHGYRVLGQAAIADAREREGLAALLERAASESPGHVAKCFNPRHGLRAEKAGATVDFVICFECLQMKVMRGGNERGVAIGRDPESGFDAALTRHGLAKHGGP
jgi:hypothetical protein